MEELKKDETSPKSKNQEICHTKCLKENISKLDITDHTLNTSRSSGL